MKEVYYIGLDIHKKIIAYCIKTASGVITPAIKHINYAA
jgi:hypothetical protein